MLRDNICIHLEDVSEWIVCRTYIINMKSILYGKDNDNMNIDITKYISTSRLRIS